MFALYLWGQGEITTEELIRHFTYAFIVSLTFATALLYLVMYG